MRIHLRFLTLIFLFVLSASICISAKDFVTRAYDISGHGTGNQNTYLVDITVSTKDKNIKDSELVKAAIHGVLFRGFNNQTARNSQKPLAGSPANEAAHIDFYQSFFSDQGILSTFGNIVPSSRCIVKSGKEYKVSATVIVQKETLLKYLQDAGVVNSLNSAF